MTSRLGVRSATLAAQPSAEFGDCAKIVLRDATKPPTGTGYVGCIDRIRFRVGSEARVLLDGADAPLAPPAPPASPVD